MSASDDNKTPVDHRRLLIVDDAGPSVEALRATLGAQGFEAVGFTDAEAALATIAPGAFAVLLVDLMMPAMNGLELMRRAHDRDPDLACVIMTGEGSIASAVEAMKEGALDYVLKPLKLSALLPVISRALTVRSLRIENARLERGLRERTTELERALEEVDRQIAERLNAEQALMQAQKIEAIGRLTGGVAHDFNNLLTAVIGNLELLQRKVEPEIPYRRFVDNALEAANRGTKVTAQLLAFSRTQRLNLQPTDVDETLRRADTLLRHALNQEVRLEVTLEADGAWARTDATQLELAALNLIVNARDALPDGGVIRLSTHADAAQVVVEVSDAGVGMTPEVLTRATEPFFTTKAGLGTGLGLAQVYGFVRQGGGDCEIESHPGAGTRVRFTLPRVEAPALAAPAPAPPPPTPQARALTVLLVDDDDQVRQSLCDGLESEGFVVRAAADGPSGLAQLDVEQPDALVLDYAMPGMTGADVARVAQARYPHVPIVFCSGYADSLALDQIESAVVLRKPITIADLSRAVRGAVG